MLPLKLTEQALEMSPPKVLLKTALFVWFFLFFFGNRILKTVIAMDLQKEIAFSL